MNTLLQYSDTLQSFDICVGDRTCTYTGSKRKLKFIEYLCETPDKQIDKHYKELFDTITKDNIDNCIFFIDHIFFGGFMDANGWLDQIITSPIQLEFIHWITYCNRLP